MSGGEGHAHNPGIKGRDWLGLSYVCGSLHGTAASECERALSEMQLRQSGCRVDGEIFSAADPSKPLPRPPRRSNSAGSLQSTRLCWCKYSSLSCRIPPDPIICAVVTAPHYDLTRPGRTLSPPQQRTDTVLNDDDDDDHNNWPSLRFPIV